MGRKRHHEAIVEEQSTDQNEAISKQAERQERHKNKREKKSHGAVTVIESIAETEALHQRKFDAEVQKDVLANENEVSTESKK